MVPTNPQVQETILAQLRSQSTSLSVAELEQLAALVAKALEERAELGSVPEEMLEEALTPAIASPTVQLVLARGGSSIEDVTQSTVQNIFAYIIEDPRFAVPELYSSDEYCPYPGLAVFSEAEADFFCGRDEDLESFLANVKRPLLALTDPSGVGKSSFINAGVLPKLRTSYGDQGIYLTYRVNAGDDLLGDFAAFLCHASSEQSVHDSVLSACPLFRGKITGLPWVKIAEGLWKIFQMVTQSWSYTGMYEVLEYESSLELKDRRGKRATFKKREEVRYLQDSVIAYQDQAWGRIIAPCSIPSALLGHHRRFAYLLIARPMGFSASTGSTCGFYVLIALVFLPTDSSRSPINIFGYQSTQRPVVFRRVKKQLS